MFEKPHEPVLSFPLFLRRMMKGIASIAHLVLFSLIVGMLGYRLTENMGWIDCFYNAAMILSGMGPASDMHSNAGKIFAGVYALYSGLFVIAVMGILLAPVFHRVLHQFHQDRKDQ